MSQRTSGRETNSQTKVMLDGVCDHILLAEGSAGDFVRSFMSGFSGDEKEEGCLRVDTILRIIWVCLELETAVEINEFV